MNNKVENNTVLTGVTLQQTKDEMLHYRGNGLSYKLGFLGIACSVLGAFICLNSFQPNMLGFLKILMNIGILLFGFMCCERVKSYSKQASITLCAIGGVCILRIFWVPMNLMIWYNQYMSARSVLTNAESTEEQIASAQSTISKAKEYLGATITSFYEGKGDVNWLTPNGNIRGVIAIVFLSCAAAAFISAGVIGLIQHRRFENSTSRDGK